MVKRLYLLIPLILIFSLIFTSLTSSENMYKDISSNVFRMHILANSDSKNDQELKLKVRDAILKQGKNIFNNSNSVDDAIRDAKNHINDLKKLVDEIIKENGFNYSSNIYVGKEYFNTRKYEKFSLPSGFYNALIVELGEGRGHNWWCVMYPSVCMSGCMEDFKETLTEDEIREITSRRYLPKFKILEIYERIKSKISLDNGAKIN